MTIICDVIKVSDRLSKDGRVISFAFHHADNADDVVKAPAGSQWQMTLVPLDENGNPEGGDNDTEVEESHRPGNKTPPASAPEQPARAPKAFREMSYAQQAGILCADPKFWQFLEEQEGNELVQTEEDAVCIVRNICLVDSRRDIIPGSAAAQAWRELVDRYRVWELVPV